MYSYGIQKFILKTEPKIDPENWQEQVLPRNYFSYFDDIQWAYDKSKNLKALDNKQLYDAVFNSVPVQQKISELAKNKKRKVIEKKAHTFMTELLGNYNQRTVSWFMYATHKSLRKYFEQIEVSE